MKIIIAIDGKEVTLDESEARRVYDELARIFGPKNYSQWMGMQSQPSAISGTPFNAPNNPTWNRPILGDRQGGWMGGLHHAPFGSFS